MPGFKYSLPGLNLNPEEDQLSRLPTDDPKPDPVITLPKIEPIQQTPQVRPATTPSPSRSSYQLPGLSDIQPETIPVQPPNNPLSQQDRIANNLNVQSVTEDTPAPRPLVDDKDDVIEAIPYFQGRERSDSVLENAYLDIKEQGEGLVQLFDMFSEDLKGTAKMIAENFGPAMVAPYEGYYDAYKKGVLLETIERHPVDFAQTALLPLTLLASTGGAVAKGISKSSKVANAAKTIEKISNIAMVAVDPVTGIPGVAASKSIGAIAKKMSGGKTDSILKAVANSKKMTTLDQQSIIKEVADVTGYTGPIKTEQLDFFNEINTPNNINKSEMFLEGLESGKIQNTDLNKYAGSINLERIDSSVDVKKAQQFIIDDIFGGFEEQTRGKISHESTIKMAKEIGLTDAEILKVSKGSTFNAEELVSARILVENAKVDMLDRAKILQNPGSDTSLNKMEFAKSFERFTMVQKKVAGLQAEAGRALSSGRIIAKSERLKTKRLFEFIDQVDNDQNLKSIAEDLLEAAETQPEKVGKYANQISKANTWDKIIELRQSFLLSNPTTHAANILSNAMTLGLTQIVEPAVDALVDFPLSKIGKKDTIRVAELGYRLRGLSKGLMLGTRNGLYTFLSEFNPKILGKLDKKSKLLSTDPLTKAEISFAPKISGVKGKTLRTPMAALQGADVFFKTLSYSAELEALAFRDGLAKGLNGSKLSSHINKILINPSDDIAEKAIYASRVATFTNDFSDNFLGKLGKNASNMRRDIPALKLVLPFIRTPVNVLEFSLKRTPLAPMFKDIRSDIAAGGLRRTQTMNRIAMGTSVGLGLYGLANEGQITGTSESLDPKERNLLRTQGWQPLSFKTKDGYVSFARLEPLSTIAGMSADINRLQNVMDDKEANQVTSLIVGSLSDNIRSKFFLQGLSDFLNLMNPKSIEDREKYAQNLVASFVPSGVAQMNRVNDPFLRDTNSLIEKIRSRLPFDKMIQEYADVPPLGIKLNIWGEPIKLEMSGNKLFDMANPFYMTTDKKDFVTQQMIDIEYFPGIPGKKNIYRDVEVTPEEYQYFRKESGTMSKRLLDSQTGSGQFNNKEVRATWLKNNDDYKKKVISDIIDGSRSATKQIMLQEFPDLRDRYNANVEAKNKIKINEHQPYSK